jgi:hypothetical protein
LMDTRIVEAAREICLVHEKRPPGKLNLLLMGDTGTGKTRAAITARQPVLIHSMDPEGTRTRELQPFIRNSSVLVEHFENDSWKSPMTFQRWYKRFNDLKSMGFFDHLGTYMIDSITFMVRWIGYDIVRCSPTPTRNRTLAQNDYKTLLWTILDLLGDVLELPCDVIVTGHLGIERDEVTGAMETALLLDGKQSREIPNMFTEKWISRVLRTTAMPEYRFQVINDGKYKASTRIGGGVFEMLEKQDIKALLRKAGLDASDKPNLSTQEGAPKGEKP